MKDLKKFILEFKKKKYTKNFFLHPTFLDKDDEVSVSKVVQSKWISNKGRKTNEFEKKIKNFFKVKSVIAVNSGTSGLFLSLKSIGVKNKDEVIIPNLTFIATANAVIYCGAKPHLVDTSRSDLNMCPKSLDLYLSKQTKIIKGQCFNKKTGNRISAMIVVHVFGHMCHMDEFKKISKKYNISLIEDAAEAFGSKFKGKNPGYYSDIAVLSFNGNKIVSTGAGGAVLTNNLKLSKTILSLSTINNRMNSLHRDHKGVGYNMRMPALNAALGMSQIKKIKNQIKKKRKLYKNYSKLLKSKKNKFFTIYKENQFQKSNYWLQTLILEEKFKNYLPKCVKIFNQLNVSVRPIWKPLNKISYLKNSPKSNLKNSTKIYKRVICIPSN